MMRFGCALLFAGLLAAAGKEEKPAPAVAGEEFHARLLEIARSYAECGRVDDEARWAPALCRMPNPAVAHVSASKDTDTHGRKLYSLFAKQRDDYLRAADKQTVGQFLVKESWVPEEVKDDGQPLSRLPRTVTALPKNKTGGDKLTRQVDTFVPYARKDGRLYHAARQGDLFIMFKADPATPGTDNGWVYGTVSPDGKKVSSAGRVESCMKCHLEAPHDRLFGLKK